MNRVRSRLNAIGSVAGLAALVLAALGGLPAKGAEPAPLRLIGRVALPDVEGRIDHLSVDLARQRLYVAALGDDTVEVIDLRSGTRAETIRGLREPQGVRVLRGVDRLLVAGGGDGQCCIYDASAHLLGVVPGLPDADNVRDASAGRLVYVGYGGGAIAIIDPVAMRKAGEIPLPGHPESFQLSADGVHLFVNVPGAHRIVVLDQRTRSAFTRCGPDATRGTGDRGHGSPRVVCKRFASMRNGPGESPDHA